MSKREKDFKFHIPVDLIKADDSDEGEWKIQGIASTPDEDLQGETVNPDGLDISPLKTGKGILNYDHKPGFENVLGEVEDADFVDMDGKKCLMVKGYLFKHQERAKGLYNILKSLKKGSSKRVQMSIEGKVIQRDFVNNKAIKKARIDKVALTLDPVNPYTYAELVKSLNSPDPILDSNDLVEIKKSDLEAFVELAKKALAAGIGYAGAPTAMSGGEAMASESLEQAPKNVTYDKHSKKKKKLTKSDVKLLFESIKKAHPSEDPLKLAELILDAVVDRFEE